MWGGAASGREKGVGYKIGFNLPDPLIAWHETLRNTRNYNLGLHVIKVFVKVGG